jgi:putative copper export protein
MAHSCHLTTWEAENGRISVQGQSRQIVHETPHPQHNITTAKWTGGMAQVAEHMLSKRKL